MGIVGTILLIGTFTALLVAFLYLYNGFREAPYDNPWPHRVVGAVMLVLGVAIVDAYIVDIPSPFEPPAISAPHKSPAPPQVVEPKLRTIDPPIPGSSAGEQHRQLLREWDPPPTTPAQAQAPTESKDNQ